MSFPLRAFCSQDTRSKYVDNSVYFYGLKEVLSASCQLDICFRIAAAHEDLSRADDQVDLSKSFTHFLGIVPRSMNVNESV
jgi:hypothetical protein